MEERKWWLRFLVDIPLQSWRSLRSDWLRIAWIAILFIIIFTYFIVTDAGSKSEKVSLHFSIELLGAVLVFLLLERNIEKVAELSKSKIRELSEFPFAKFIEEVRGASVIRIQDFSLVTLLGDGSTSYRKEFQKALREALEREETRVEIIVARPNSAESKARARTLSRKLGGADETFDAISDSLQKLLNFVERLPTSGTHGDVRGRIRLRFFGGHPGFAYYQAGEWAYVTFYSERGPTMNDSQLYVPLSSAPGTFFGRSFNELRDSAPERWAADEIPTWLADLRKDLDSQSLDLPVDSSSDA